MNCSTGRSPQGQEVATCIYDLVHVAASVEKVFKGNWTLGGRDNVDILLLGPSVEFFRRLSDGEEDDSPNPVGKFFRIWDSRRQENNVDVVRKHYYNFLPNNAPLFKL